MSTASDHAGSTFPRETNALMIRLYDEVRKLAHDRLRRHRPGRGVQTTDIVHEVYLKLSRSGERGWDSRAHFFGSAARAMKQVLVDLARASRLPMSGATSVEDVESSPSDGGDTLGVTLLVRMGTGDYELDLQTLASHLYDLNAIDPRKADVVVCKFFAGMSNEHISVFLGVSERTVERDWHYARAWLGQRMVRGSGDGDGP